MDHDHAEKILKLITGLDPGIGEALHLIDEIADETEKKMFLAAIGKIMFDQHDLIRMIIRQHRDLEEDFSHLDDGDEDEAV
jgi:hypothetical protein